jgi:ferric-dicitrate binding protein FerR (iron transport regulator)
MEKYTEHIDELIVRYFDGSITAEEKNILFRWVKECRQNEEMFRSFSLIWKTSQLTSERSDREKRWKRIQNEEFISRKKFTFSRKRIAYSAIAVASVLFLTIIISSRYLFSNADLSDAIALHEFVMPENTKGNVELADHSVVWLNRNSSLSYPETFNDGIREVSIQGEACFDVTKDADKPFVVNLGVGQIKVLGTTFNVKNKADMAEVTLITGSIEFYFHNKPVLLKPNEKITFFKSTGEWRIEQVDASIYAIWTKDRLVFDNADLTYIIACLEKWYDINILYREPIENISGISLSVRNETADEVLNAIQRITSVSLEVSD